MENNWILNASPVILLGKADILGTISSLSKVWTIPEGVIREVEIKRDVDPYLKQLSESAEVVRKEISIIHPNVAAWDLGRGESEVLTLALDHDAGVVLDDLQARKCASLHNIPLIGSVGLILKAKRKGLVTSAKPLMKRLIDAGLYIEQGFVDRLLHEIGE